MLGSLIKHFFRKPLTYWDELSYYHDDKKVVSLVKSKAEFLQQYFIEWPALVHMETVAVCNAACSFCPYPTLERKGTRMSDALIEKIINDLTDIPKDIRFQLAPYKVSDPFLEARLFDIIKLANEKLPNADISIISNGAPLTEKKIDQLSSAENIAYLNISLNYCDPDEYESVMKIPFGRTIERITLLHQKKQEGKLPFPIRLTRVSEDLVSDTAFLHWTKEHFPLFTTVIARRNDWIGNIQLNQQLQVPNVSCHRWFDFSITATGIVAMCCMDSEAKYPKGDVNKHHVLEIYNQPHLKKLRETLISRYDAGDPCNRCTYLNV